MKTLVVVVMIANAALFFFGAVQHVGVTIGPFHEPRIIPAAVVETTCGIALLWGVVVLARRSGWGSAIAANFVALAGVLTGIAALAAGRGPRTASNDLYHHIMLGLIAISLLMLFYGRSRVERDVR